MASLVGEGGHMRQERTARRRGPAALAVGALAAAGVALAACSGPGPDDPSPPATPTPPTADDPATLRVASYAAPGAVAELVAEYDADHPEVVVEVDRVDPASSHAPTLEEDLRGAELADLVAFGDGVAGVVRAAGERFVDLRDHPVGARTGEVHGWALAQVTDPDGRLVGFPTEIAPEALCFRADLLAEAGIAADREELAALLEADGGGWDVYLELGRQYHAATGRAWFDSPVTLWDAMVRQRPTGYTAVDGTPLAPDDGALRDRWELLTAAVAEGLSARERPWEWDGGRAFVDGSFATTVCSPWFLDVMASNVVAGDGGPRTGWDVVDALPGGGSAWGTSYLAVPASSEHPAEAAALLDWLTRPEQQVRLYAPGVALPSTRAAIDAVVRTAGPAELFNGVVAEAVFAARAEDVQAHLGGPDDLAAGGAFGAALLALDEGRVADADEAWDRAVAELAELAELAEPDAAG